MTEKKYLDYPGLQSYNNSLKELYATKDTATIENNGLMSSTDKNKLDNLNVDVEVTQAEFNALSSAEKNNGTSYFITDAQSGGGGGVIDGSTVTPTDDIQKWLACAGLHQSYTTLNEILADSAVLSALMASTNAVDYLVRSTTWASTICADETAMNCIGLNDYCAEILLDNSTWRTAICNSTYFEEVLNVKVPIMTSPTTPSGIITADGEWNPTYAKQNAFNNNSLGWLPTVQAQPQNSWIQYQFPSAVRIYKCNFKQISTPATRTFNFQGSNDGTNYTNMTSSPISMSSTNDWESTNFANSTNYTMYKVQFVTSSASMGSGDGYKFQFYGRGKSPVVDTKADISAIATEETGATASREYKYGEHFYKNGKFCTCTAQSGIAQGATFTLGTNYVEGTVASVLKRDDFITTSSYYQSSKDSYLTINGRHYVKTTSVPCYSCCYLDTSNSTCPLFISTYPDGVHYYVPPVSGVNPEAHFEYVQTFVEHNKTRWFCSDKGYAMGANVSGDKKLSGKYATIEDAANALLSIIYG